MRRHSLTPLCTLLGALVLAGALACQPKQPPTPAATPGGGAPPVEQAPAEGTASVPVTEETTPQEDPAGTAGDTNGAAMSFDAANFFAMNCAGCHGANGEGVAQKGPPYAKVLHEPDDELIHALLEGEKKMPAFKDKLSTDEATQMIAWVRKSFGTATETTDTPKEG